MEGDGRIQRLDQAVINRIAAGEVIQRPCNAIKEMVENSLDAKCTSIQVTVKSGGLKMLQVQDNGCGIEKDDLQIVCERFTTSKLKKFEDLSNLNTYGFRGEALASISHIAHVTITTRTAASKCAYKAAYSDGKLVPLRPGGTSEPKLCAGNKGTTITVEDLFYNVTTRRKALKSPSEELAKITDVMTKYAVHNSGIGFALKKYGEVVTEIKTSVDGTIEDNIGLLYGSSVQKELLSVSTENVKLGFKMAGFVTNVNYSVKRLQFLLFINNRLVDSSALRKAVEVIYSSFLPKNCHPFVYFRISISPENIDVNVHPTKHEVQFLHEDMIIESIQKTIEDRLLKCDSSRTYYTQSLLPSTSFKTSKLSSQNEEDSSKLYDYKMVRTDAAEKKLDAFALPKLSDEQAQPHTSNQKSLQQTHQKTRQEVHLTSVISLQNMVKKKRHEGLTSLFSGHTFVGCVDQTRALIQFETGLYLLDMSVVSKELFFQLVLTNFGNFGKIKLTPPAPIYELVLLAIESPSGGWSPECGPKEKLAQYVVELLATKAEMLCEYFSMEIRDGSIHTLPVLLDKYSPNLDKLPHFLLCLAVEVDWSTEKECFFSFAQECAAFYSIQYDPFISSDPIPDDGGTPQASLYKISPWKWIIEHVIFPALRVKLVPPCSMADNGSILQIANLHELYKVFERC